MRTVSALELRKKLGQILDAASAGERIVIERDRVPLAMLVPCASGDRPEQDELTKQTLDALDRLDDFRARMLIEYPPQKDEPDAATVIRWERSRDDPGFDSYGVEREWREQHRKERAERAGPE